MDEFRSILGDHCDEDQASFAILKHNFDLERAIDEVLSKGQCGVIMIMLNVLSIEINGIIEYNMKSQKSAVKLNTEITILFE